MTAPHGHRLSAIAAALGTTVQGDAGDPVIEHLVIDSRKAVGRDDALFIALPGPRHDGHHYIRTLFDQGQRHFLVSAAVDIDVAQQANIIRVPDTLAALHRIAAWHRAQFTYPVIGITGSNGKTIVKEWLFQLLRDEERIVHSPGSWNSQVGVPLSIWRMGPEHTLGIFEAGISKPGEMEALEAIVRPTVGVFTHLGHAHDEGFEHAGAQAKAIEKLTLFRRAQVLVHPHDLQELDELHHRLPGVAFKAWDRSGMGGEVFLRADRITVVGDATYIEATHDGATHRYTIPFTDVASVANALTCITVCLHLGRSPEWIRERLVRLEPVEMRLRTMQGIHGTTLIDDSYSNDLGSFLIALDHQKHMAHARKRVVVVSDITESGETSERLYAEMARELARAGVHQVIGVGPAIGAQRARFPAGSRFHATTDDLLAHEDLHDLAGAVVLVKGARVFALERAVHRWQQHVHGTELLVDLEAIRHNLNHYRALLTPPVRTMAMVKAFGYGSGAVELARLFAHEQVHYLGVAYADEGIELRNNGIDRPILVMNPEPVPFEVLHRFRLEPEVYDARSLREAIEWARTTPDAPPVHIKLDTGMHRLGFTEADLPELLQQVAGVRHLRAASVLSHLVGSEDLAHDAFTRMQIATFRRMADAVADALGQRPLRHIANSAAIGRFPEAHFDMVRVGIGLHGIGADARETASLRPTVTLRSPIAQIKRIAPGETVGYARRWTAEGERRIATLPIGYADGLSRRLSNGVGRVWIDGKAAPIVGTVCMDMCMVDVTAIDCAEGDPAHVFDSEHPVGELARDLGTIPYEVLTSIAQRVKRVYVRS